MHAKSALTSRAVESNHLDADASEASVTDWAADDDTPVSDLA